MDEWSRAVLLKDELKKDELKKEVFSDPFLEEARKDIVDHNNSHSGLAEDADSNWASAIYDHVKKHDGDPQISQDAYKLSELLMWQAKSDNHLNMSRGNKLSEDAQERYERIQSANGRIGFVMQDQKDKGILSQDVSNGMRLSVGNAPN